MTVRVAVVGAGIMGANHARVLSRLRDAELVSVTDLDRAKGETLARALQVTFLADPAAIADVADAVVLAVPSEAHAEMGIPLLEAGLDLLVEKPIATSTGDAQDLIDVATKHERILAVGHIERFNPAVIELARHVDQPVHLELRRISPFSPRVTADVVLDLMIHDLDLALSLAGAPISEVSAVGRRVRTEQLDLATTLLRFGNGVTATVTASRVGQSKVRSVELTQLENFVIADLVRMDVTIHRVDHSEFLSEGGARYRQRGLIEIPFLDVRGEPLALELSHFVECVRDRAIPQVSGADGLRALELALRVSDLAGRTEPAG